MLPFLGRLLACICATGLIYVVLGVIIRNADQVRMPLTVVFSATVWFIAFARYLVDLLPSIKRKAERDALEVWNGRYYAFDNRQLRLYLVDGVIWVPAVDVAALLDPKPDARELRYLGADHGLIPGQKHTGYTEAGLLRLLTTRSATRRATHDTIRFKHWLEKEAFPNLRRLPASAT
jgi:hypothetical protein